MEVDGDIYYAPGVTPEEKELDRALCNFCNDATDAYEPVDQWNDSVLLNLKALCAAYNNWYGAKIMRRQGDR